MGFTSILDKIESAGKNRPKTEYLQDLNLDMLIEQIRFQYAEDITSYYEYFPENEECEQYRREVYGDVKKESVREGLAEFADKMRERARALRCREEVEMDLQKAVWHLWEVYEYCSAFEGLYEKLNGQAASEGFRSFVEYLGAYLADEKFIQMKRKSEDLIAQVMMQCGLFVGAKSFESGIYPAFFTHFTRREDSEMNSGRLDEELGRMSRIIDNLEESSLVLLNESFATTTEKEGSVIAYDIIKALTESGVKVLMVTHLLSFAKRMYEEGKNTVEFLSAERRADGRRTFKMIQQEPQLTSFGLDLYEQIISQGESD